MQPYNRSRSKLPTSSSLSEYFGQYIYLTPTTPPSPLSPAAIQLSKVTSCHSSIYLHQRNSHASDQSRVLAQGLRPQTKKLGLRIIPTGCMHFPAHLQAPTVMTLIFLLRCLLHVLVHVLIQRHAAPAVLACEAVLLRSLLGFPAVWSELSFIFW